MTYCVAVPKSDYRAQMVAFLILAMDEDCRYTALKYIAPKTSARLWVLAKRHKQGRNAAVTQYFEELLEMSTRLSRRVAFRTLFTHVEDAV